MKLQMKEPDCGQWLEEKNIKKLDITNVIVQDSNRINGLLGIEGDSYHPIGVGENDIFIIATARDHGA